MNLDVVDGHVDVGGKNGDEQEGQSPAGEDFDAALGNEEPDSAEQLENAADFNAEKREGNCRRHDGQEEAGINEMDRPREEEKRGEEKANDEAGDQGNLRDPSLR